MQLLVTSPGTLVSQDNGCFRLKNGDKKMSFSPERVTSIVLCNKASLTTQAIVLAMKYHIDVVVLDGFGDPVGRMWYGHMGRAAVIQRRQVHWAQQEAGLLFGRSLLVERLEGQYRFLKALQRTRPDRAASFTDALEQVSGVLGQLREAVPLAFDEEAIGSWRAQVMGWEGAASRAYFRCIAQELPSAFVFRQRSRRPAQDPYNAALNYAYGVLYSRVERACLLAGLDPYTGMVHALHPYRPALVCDLIEPVRVWAETVVTYLFTGRRFGEEHTTVTAQGTTLNSAGKELLMPAFEAYLAESVRHDKRNMSRQSILLSRAHALANAILSEEPDGLRLHTKQREW